MQVSQKISTLVATTRDVDVPDAALRQAKAGIADWLFVALAGQVDTILIY